jgi:preprotein translocase subunit YajC
VLGGRKEKKKRAALMASLKKHDKVQTVGGIIGTVVELTAEEVVLRVDETS